MTRGDLIRAMHGAGLRLDDAALAADVALAKLRRQRDALILSARSAGLSYRQIAAIVGLDHSRVVQVVNRDASDSPRPARMM